MDSAAIQCDVIGCDEPAKPGCGIAFQNRCEQHCGDRVAALVRVPTEPEAFASLADAIRQSYEPLGGRVHVSSLHRSITVTVPPTVRMGAESDWHIKFRRLPK